MKPLLSSLLAILCGAVFSPSSAHAAIFSVSNVNDDGAGSLRQALTTANTTPEEDTIAFDATMFSSARTITLTSGELPITQSVSIMGPRARFLTVSGNYASRVFNVSNSTAKISGLTLANGASDSGAAVKVSGGATLLLSKCAIHNNSSTSQGGGIFNAGTLTLDSCTLSENRSTTQGGGLFNVGKLNLTNSTLAYNSAQTGAGITNSSTGTATLLNCTLSRNIANNLGGGIDNISGGKLDLSNTIVAGNEAPTGADVNGALATNDHNILNTTLELAGLSHHLMYDGGPTRTLNLFKGSPAIDAGNSTLSTDQRDIGRPKGNAPDIGAIEFIADPTGAAALIVTTTDDANAWDGQISLAEAIISANDETTFPGADTITFAIPGQGPHTIGLHSRLFPIRGTVTIDNTGQGAPPIILKRVSSLDSGIMEASYSASVTVKGLAFANGRLTGGSEGGALINRGVTSVENCTFLNNYATAGGAIVNASTGTINVSNSTFTSNEGAVGGAIVNYGNLLVDGCTFSKNRARFGAGLSSSTSGLHTVTVRNSTFTLNSATVDSISAGGAINSSTGATVNLENCTITRNQATVSGGGVQAAVSGIRAHNCLIAGNSPDDVDSSNTINSFTSQGYNLIGTGNATGAFTATGDKIIGDAPPGLAPLADNGGPTQTVALLHGSLAFNAGDPDFNSTATPFDQRGQGFARVKFERVDIGAFEAESFSDKMALSQNNIEENQPVASGVGTFSTTNQTDNSPYAYSLVNGEGDTDNNRFKISGDQLLTNQPFDFELQNRLSIRVKSTNVRGKSVEDVFIVNVTDVNEEPTVSVSLSPTSPTTNSTLVATATAKDPEKGTVKLTYRWYKNDVLLENEKALTLALSTINNGDKGDTIGVSVIAEDSGGQTSTSKASALIGNTAPTLATANFIGRENQILSSRLNGEDADKEALAYTLLQPTRNGTLTLQSDGTFTYTPKADWSGTDSFVAIVTDGSAAKAQTTFTIAVQAINHRPVAVADNIRGYEDIPLSIPFSSLLSNDSNGEKVDVVDALKIIEVTPVAGLPGKLKLDIANQLILFTPKSNWSGTTSFSYTVQDSGDFTSKATVDLQIMPVNDAPVAVGGTMTVVSGIMGERLLSGKDVEGDALTFALSSQPSRGVAKVVKVGNQWLLRYQSKVGFVGTDRLTIVARDGKLYSAPATITIRVKANNAPQLMSLTPNRGSFMEGSTVVFEQRVRDINGVSQLDAVALLFSNSSSPDARKGATLWFDALGNRFTLTKDNGKTTFAPVPLGQTLENSQLKVSLEAGDVIRTNNSTLTLRWRVTFKTKYVGAKSLWGRVEDIGTLSAGFSKIGGITIVAPVAPAQESPFAPSAPSS